MKKKIENIAERLSVLLLIALAAGWLTACSSDDDVTAPKVTDTPQVTTSHYLVSVKAQRHITADEIIQKIKNVVSQAPENYLRLFVYDLDVAAIDYATTGPDGKAVTASGIVAWPSGWKSYDHLLSIQHGTMDIDEAPSLTQFTYEMLPVMTGHVTVMADYLGYGTSQTPDRQHPYLHARLTGTACTDMLMAARELLKRDSIKVDSDKVDLIGYSQGGQATVATVVEMERRGLGKLIRKVYAGGGPYDLDTTMNYFLSNHVSSYPRTGYIPYIIRGMEYGDQLALRDSNLYAPEALQKGCLTLFATRPLSEWHSALGADINKVVNADFFASPTYQGNQDVIQLIASLHRNSLVNGTAPTSPITLMHSPTDDFVPYINAVSAHKKWPNTTLVNLSMPTHYYGGVEFMLRYMGLWDLVKGYMPK